MNRGKATSEKQISVKHLHCYPKMRLLKMLTVMLSYPAVGLTGNWSHITMGQEGHWTGI
jgi:hypothetical protein